MLSLLQDYRRDRSVFERKGQFPRQAAVLLAITDHPDDPDIILTQRASHLSQHAGEVSFPGGKWEEGDTSLVDTALRETWEEIGLPPDQVRLISVEPCALNRNGLKVTPFVGLVSHQLELTPCPNELEAIFRVPVKFFFEDRRFRTDLYVLDGEELWSPAYRFDNYEIWGLTARILVEFLNRAFGAGIQKESDAPVRVRVRLPPGGQQK